MLAKRIFGIIALAHTACGSAAAPPFTPPPPDASAPGGPDGGPPPPPPPPPDGGTTACVAPGDGNYYVDGAADPAVATGSRVCPYATLTAVLQLLGDRRNDSTTPIVIHVLSDLGAAESYPLQVFGNTLVVGEKPGPVTVTPVVQTAIFFLHDHTTLRDFVLGGLTDSAVDVTGNDVRVENVRIDIPTIGGEAIVVEGRGPAGDPVILDHVETRALGRPNFTTGLFVSGNARVVLRGAASFDGHFVGIQVLDHASITVDETLDQAAFTAPNPQAMPSAPIQITRSAGTGMHLDTLGGSSIKGMAVTGSQGPGIEVLSGSPLLLRDSVSLGNAGSGIRVGDAGDVVDLGAADPGHNLLQVTGPLANGGAGLCLASAAASTVKANGNGFVGTPPGAAGPTNVDCATTGAVLTRDPSSDCLTGVSLGGFAPAPTLGHCSLP